MKLGDMEAPDTLRKKDQWVLWKLERRGANWTKVPYQVSGQCASSTDSASWVDYETALKALELSDQYSGIGYVFSGKDGMYGVDIDDCLRQDGTPKAWAQEILDLFPTYTEVSPSGNGLKLWIEGKLDSPRGRRLNIKDGHVEIYSTGRYFTVTKNLYGKVRAVNQCPKGTAWVNANIVRTIATPPKPSCRPAGGSSDDNRMERAEAYAGAVPGAVAGSGGHNDTFSLACTLVHGFGLSDNQAIGILRQWNQTCNPPWSNRELQHKVSQARKNGTSEDKLEEDRPMAARAEVEQVAGLGDFITRFQGRAIKERGFPEHLLDVPGFIGDMAGWISSQNPRPNPVLSLLGGIMAQSLLCGRKVKLADGARTNLYIVGLAPSGGGKQAPQTCIRKLLQSVDQGGSVHGPSTGDSAMAEALVQAPASLFLWDEFGRLLQSTSVSKGGVHRNAIQSVLLELWGSTNVIWQHKNFAQRDQNREVDQPCCSLFGLSVADHFWGGVEEHHLQDGFAARLMVVDTGDRVPSQSIIESDPPASVQEAAHYWAQYRPTGLVGDMFPTPTTIEETEEAMAVFQAIIDVSEGMKDETDRTVWARAIEKSKRLALIYACSKDPRVPVVDREAAVWATSLVTHCTQQFLAAVDAQIISVDTNGKQANKILGIIRQMSEADGYCGRSKITRRLGLSARQLNDALTTLIDGEYIEEVAVTVSRGRPPKAYRAL